MNESIKELCDKNGNDNDDENINNVQDKNSFIICFKYIIDFVNIQN